MKYVKVVQEHDLYKLYSDPFLNVSCQVSKSYMPSGEEDFKSLFPINIHGGHLGYVTWTIYIDFCFPFLRMIHMKFGFD